MFDLRPLHKLIAIILLMMVLLGVLAVSGWWKEVGKVIYPLPYRQEIFRYSKQFELDPYFVAAVIRVESRFFSVAESRRGAKGLMQLMPETARWVAQQMNLEYRPELLEDPQYNIRLGCWYLSNLLAQFDGNPFLVLAAYNGGRGRVTRWLEEGVWDGQLSTSDNIPFPETRDFVQRVWRDYQIYSRLYIR